MPPVKPERIAKYLSRCGICSRREAERLIAEGLVWVDGKIITTPATLVTSQSKIKVGDKIVRKAQERRVWLYYKPTGVLTSHNDPEGRPTLFEQLPKKLPRVISVGRLDLNSEGLILLTNDGEFARLAELPKTGWKRAYRVRVFGHIDEDALRSLREGITIEGIHYKSIEAELIRRTGRNAWLYIILTEGKNREIRRIMEHLNLQVSRLIRVAYGPFELGDLKPKEIKEVDPSDFENAFRTR